MVKNLGEWGEYTAVAWATVGASTSSYASARATVSAGEVALAAEQSGASLSLSASGWSVAPSNVGGLPLPLRVRLVRRPLQRRLRGEGPLGREQVVPGGAPG